MAQSVNLFGYGTRRRYCGTEVRMVTDLLLLEQRLVAYCDLLDVRAVVGPARQALALREVNRPQNHLIVANGLRTVTEP